MKDLNGKVAAITGVGSGIGEALALNLAKQGCDLSLNEINPERLEATIDKCKSINSSIKIHSDAFDVSNEKSMRSFAANTMNTHGRVDLMINNAGVAIGTVSAENIKKEDFDWIMGINFWGMVYGTQAFYPYLKRQKEAALVNVSSLFGLIGVAYQAAYCTTKFAIRGYTESLRMEAQKTAPHVIIHTVHPGGISTNIANDSKWVTDEPEPDVMKVNEFLVMPPIKAAGIIVKGVNKKQSRILIGNDAKRASLIQRIWPEGYSKMLGKGPMGGADSLTDT
ncbi:MAG: SDR family NAD(P)-dependent oxidoreductase [Saprospiraceae bacterium]|nr:SDR family NAD(P)-dependent oxidoreductase [Saprospiraceae bacterium]